MLTNVFTKTLRGQRRGLVGWGIGIALTVVVMAAVWPSFSNVDINKLVAEYPEGLKKAFNIDAMNTGIGFMNAELFSLVLPVVFVIYAVSRGSRLVAGEEEDGTMEVLATLPVSRRTMLLHKAAALAVSVGVLTVILAMATGAGSVIFGLDIGAWAVIVGSVSMGFLGLEFGLLALALSAATGRLSLAMGVAAGIGGFTYVCFLLSQLVASLRGLRLISPFYAATVGGPLGPSLPAIAWSMPAVGLVALLIAVVVFDRRDLMR